MAYNVHEIIKKYSLPAIRGKESVPDFLRQYYEAYIKDLEECDMILEIFELQENGFQILKYAKFDRLMKYLISSHALREWGYYQAN